MSTIRGEVNDGLPVVPSYWYTLSTKESNHVLFDFSRLLLDRLSEAAWGAAGFSILASITSNDLRSLCHYDTHDTIMGLSSHDQLIVRQCIALFQKREDIDLGVDRKRVATEKFIAAEQLCAETNSLFRAWSQGRLQFTPRVERVFHDAQCKIAKLLGEAPPLSTVRLRFGPGATTASPKKNACPVVKLKSGIQCSTNFPLDREIIAENFNPATYEGVDSVEVGIHLSKVEFVPKNAKTDRAICVEPTLNSMHQNGLGDLLAARLRRVGIDIQDQGPNQRAALYGSISGESATLDLSSASDTVALGLVHHLFPASWADLLINLSTREGVVDGKMTTFNKLSSMGNGFTFPVETIVFWALAQSAKDATCPGHRYRVLVYGDDIIVPIPAVPLLKEVLHAAGFILNSEKSFWSGEFRESCGCDYVLGESVRPVFVSSSLEGADFFRIRNFFHARGDIPSSNFWESRIDISARLYGPSGYGDGHLHAEVFPTIRKEGWGPEMGAMFETYGRKPKTLDRRAVEKLAVRISYVPMEWDAEGRKWVRSRRKYSSYEFHEKHYALVRKLATYTAMCSEGRDYCLTPSDEARSTGTHVYADRRMPDPQPGGERMFTVPGDGARMKQRVYIFKTS